MLDPLLLFAQVVDAGGFAAVARQSGRTRAAVAKQIAQLERDLGAQLLVRTTRSMRLTEAGAALYEHCRRIAEEVDAARETVATLQSAPRGRLRVACPMSFGRLHLSALLPEFLRRHPGITVELSLSDAFADLRQERFDLAVRIAELGDSTLVARRLAGVRQVVCAAPAYLRRRGIPQVPDDLRQHDCLVYTNAATPDVWRFRDRHQVRVGGPLAANNGEVLAAAAVSGQGIVYLPTFLVADDVRAGRLRILLPDWTFSRQALYVLYPPTPHVAPKIRAFIDYLVASCTPEPAWERNLETDAAASTGQH